jgi:hypothetical protein
MITMNVHNTDAVSATAHDCNGQYTGPFTSLQVKFHSNNGKLDVTLFGLSRSYARRLAAAINAVAEEDEAIEEAA